MLYENGPSDLSPARPYELPLNATPYEIEAYAEAQAELAAQQQAGTMSDRAFITDTGIGLADGHGVIFYDPEH